MGSRRRTQSHFSAGKSQLLLPTWCSHPKNRCDRKWEIAKVKVWPVTNGKETKINQSTTYHKMNTSSSETTNNYIENDKKRKINKCSHCEYATVWLSNLRKHVKAHLGVKPHKCQQCDYAFIDAVHLRRRVRSHTGEKSHKCNECNYASVRADDLKKHSKTHTGEKSYKCN